MPVTNWKNREPDPYKGQNKRFYRGVDADGNEVFPEMSLELLNNVPPGKEGVAVNAGRLNDMIWPVGCTRMTAETNLSDDWLYCNGDSMAATDYPELAPLLLRQKFDRWDIFTDTGYMDNPVFDGANTLFFTQGNTIKAYVGKPSAPAQTIAQVWPSQFNPPCFLGRCWASFYPSDGSASTRGVINYAPNTTSSVTSVRVLPDNMIITGMAATDRYFFLIAHQHDSGLSDYQRQVPDQIYYAENIAGPYTSCASYSRGVYSNGYWSYYSGSLTAFDNQVFYSGQSRSTTFANDSNITTWSAISVRNASGYPIMSGTAMGIEKSNGVFFLSGTYDDSPVYAYCDSISMSPVATTWNYPAPINSSHKTPRYFDGEWYVPHGDTLYYSTSANFVPSTFTGFAPQFYAMSQLIPINGYMVGIVSSNPIRMLINDPNRYSLPVIPSVLPTYIRGK